MEREQRAHARKRISTAVTFNVAGGTPLRGWLRDISRGGCFVASPSFSSVGEIIELELRLPAVRQAVAGKGRVVWVREKSVRDLPAGMGVQFLEVPEESLAAIDALSGTTAVARSRTFIGIAPPPPTSSPSFSPEAVPIDVVEALKAEAAAARSDADLEKTEKTQLPVAQLEAQALAAEAQTAAGEPEPPPPPPPPPPPSQPKPTAAPPIDLPRREGSHRKRWIVAGGLGVLGAGGLVALIVGIAHRDRGAMADAAFEATSDGLGEAAEIAATDATLAATETEDVGAPRADARVEDSAVDARALDAGRDGGHDAGRDAGRDAGHGARDAGHDAGHGHKPKPKPR